MSQIIIGLINPKRNSFGSKKKYIFGKSDVSHTYIIGLSLYDVQSKFQTSKLTCRPGEDALLLINILWRRYFLSFSEVPANSFWDYISYSALEVISFPKQHDFHGANFFFFLLIKGNTASGKYLWHFFFFRNGNDDDGQRWGQHRIRNQLLKNSFLVIRFTFFIALNIYR